MIRQWISTTIKTNVEANEMLSLLEKLQPTIGAFDTETNGLHIAHCTPFIFQFGFLHPTELIGYTYAVDLEKQPELGRQVLTCWHDYVKTNIVKYLAHNVKYDLHMLSNYGIPYIEDNLSDSMFYIRYAHDAVQVQNGGPSLKLKDYASQYISTDAKHHEKLLLNERSSIAKELNIKLKNRLAGLVPPTEWNAKAYTLGVLQDMFKDPISDWTWLPTDAQEAYTNWLNIDVPESIRPFVVGIMESDLIPYNLLNRTNLLKYAHKDIVYVLEIYEMLQPIITARGNDKALSFEESLILPLWDMERTGFNCDQEYLNNSRAKLKNYILQRRQDLYDLCQRKINIGQHALVKEILEDDYNVKTASTGADVLDQVKSEIIAEGNNPEAVQFIDIIQELRTLEKWYSAYIIRFVRQLKITSRLYTQINQVGAVSGRVTSDFQQFPKDAILTNTGEELFHPRKMIIPTGGDYKSMIYLD
jgi:DNA polymerase-1